MSSPDRNGCALAAGAIAIFLVAPFAAVWASRFVAIAAQDDVRR